MISGLVDCTNRFCQLTMSIAKNNFRPRIQDPQEPISTLEYGLERCWHEIMKSCERKLEGNQVAFEFYPGDSTWKVSEGQIIFALQDQISKDSLRTPICEDLNVLFFVRLESPDLGYFGWLFWGRKCSIYVCFSVFVLGVFAFRSGMTHILYNTRIYRIGIFILYIYITSCISEKLFAWFNKGADFFSNFRWKSQAAEGVSHWYNCWHHFSANSTAKCSNKWHQDKISACNLRCVGCLF